LIFIALVIVPFLIFTYSIEKNSTIKETLQKKVKQFTKIKEGQKMKRKKCFVYLTKYTPKEFFENISEFRGYFVNKKRDVNLNPDKLVNFLYIYFRSVLLYPSPDMREYIVTGPDGKIYKLVFSGDDKKGEKRSGSLGGMSNTLLAEVSSNLLKSANISQIISLIELFTRAIATPNLDKRHKLNILNVENKVFNEIFSDAIRLMPENKAIEALDVRQKLVFSELKELKRAQVKSKYKNIESFNNIISKYIQYRIDVLIANNKFIDIFQFLYEEIEKKDDESIIATLLEYLVIYNNLFLLERKEDIRETVSEYRSLIGEEKYAILNEMLNFSPEKIVLKNFSIMQIGLDSKNIKFENVDYQKVKTIISFVVPYKSSKAYTKYEFLDKYIVEFVKLKNLFDDPIFLFFNRFQQNINGMPTTIFSDAVGNVNHSTVVRITMNDFFHPDFDLVDDRVTFIDFEEKEAKLGRKYYPYKDKIIEILRDLNAKHSEQIPFILKTDEININLVSNHLVNYIDENNSSIFHQCNTITNLDSYLKVKKRYLEKITELNLSDEFLNIRELLETEIDTSRSLRIFISRALDLTVKKSIELRGIYKFMWKDDKQKKPLNEPDIQPIIKTHLQTILEAKGIQISRETIASNGSLDFLCSYTSNGSLFKVGIELKQAHGNLLSGLTKQLPQYLKDEGTKHGIFLVLWFKNDGFRKPAKYKSIPDLIKHLDQNIPKKYKFTNMVIDCTKQISPSKM